jgi:hypothetical protein
MESKKICKFCNNKMQLVIQEIMDTGYGYYCYHCGALLITDVEGMLRDEKWSSEEIEKEWIHWKNENKS